MAVSKKTSEQFIKDARKIYGDRYDYSRLVYNGSRHDVCVICEEHGEFTKRASDFLQGKGCPKCANAYKPHPRRYTTEKWVEKAKFVHGDKYDYSKVEYVSPYDDVIIVCPKHGEFKQKASYHLSGNGCTKCGYERVSASLIWNKEQFIERAKEIYGNRYDYSKVEYVNNKTEVIVICPKHGEFKVRPDNHIYNRSGCPNCSTSKLEENVKKMLCDNGIVFETQKEFDWLRNDITNYPMRYDIFIPSENLAIECQGEQHFRSGGIIDEERHVNIVHRDEVKNKLSNDHGIKLLYYIPKEFIKLTERFEIYSNDNVFYDLDSLYFVIKKRGSLW